MLKFNLDDVNESPLRQAAVTLGIPNAANMLKADLVSAIKNKISPNDPVLLAQNQVVSDNKGIRNPAILISLASLLVAILAAVGTWYATYNAVNKLNHELSLERQCLEHDMKVEWQAVRVYDIICKGTESNEKWTGLTFDEIKSKYSEEVLAEKEIKLGKDDLQPNELKKILKNLINCRLVSTTYEHKYAILRDTVASKDCYTRPTTFLIQQSILKLLSTESGKHKIEKLISKISSDLKVANDDVYATANCMKSGMSIHVDVNGLVWSAIEMIGPYVPKIMPPGDKPKD